MTSALKIGLDLDGVIIDHTDNKLKLSLERGFELEPWQTNSNVMGQFVPEDKYMEILSQIYNDMTPKAWPVRQALESIAELSGDIYIISARGHASIRYAQAWLDQHRIHDIIPAERIFFCGDESEKKQHCNRLGLQVYLDDKVGVLNTLPLNVRRMLLDTHDIANKLNPPKGIGVISGWSDFVEMIGVIAK